jgi:2-C-methyl-D-erythritol 4-phosphate cytidylyltransferase
MSGKVGVIIPAAGAGKRLGGISKPLIEIGGKPIILGLLQLFSSLPHVARICVAVPKESMASFEEIVARTEHEKLIEIVPGGPERPLSVRNAFESIKAILSGEDLVCIHDAARPLLSEEDLKRVVKAGWEHGAAFLASKVKDTLKTVDESGYCTSTIDRSGVYAAQTPQVMKSRFLSEAYEKVGDCSDLTDETMLMERIGIKSFVVEPNHFNFKITTSEDLELYKRLTA